MIIREAHRNDIQAILSVRNSVKENKLPDPNMVTALDCLQYITERGKGWVSEIDGQIVGFSIVDLQENNVWALFMHPDFEKKGVGKQLHDIMLDWYFEQTKSKVWLGTSPNTRAESFYSKAGWKEVGMYEGREIKFEMTYEEWQSRSTS